MKDNIKSRIDSLRAKMAQDKINAVIIPQSDPHQSEYMASHWQVRRFFSGFTGSAGDLIVTADKALLWTDSRYFIQAARQLEGTGIQLMKEGVPGTPSQYQWLLDNLNSGDTIGIDTAVCSMSRYDDMERALALKSLKIVHFDPAQIWEDRPALPKDKIFIHEEKYAGRSAKDKIADALAEANKHAASKVFISALDEIAWLLNIRSSDVKYNPVAHAFLFLSESESVLFVDEEKLTPEVKQYLAEQGVKTAPYDALRDSPAFDFLRDSVLVDPTRNSRRVMSWVDVTVPGPSVVALAKAVKNETQIAGIRAAMERDGVALVKSFMEIERRLAIGEGLTELDVADILRKFRGEQPLFFDESFGTIAGYGPHGAIVHYEATPETSSVIKTDNLLLIDSGAQYLDGTTDITRTISLGKPTAEQRRDFTLVMKGHIALARAQFPEGTTGHQLDVLARMFLWNNGLSYLHGTGHGVGHFLNVHEGPQSVRLNHVPVPLLPGMIVSDEPGIYRENVHGIRCENLILTIPSVSNEFGNFFKFETLTLFPFDLTLFDTTLMTPEEIEWVNNYHATVRARLTPLLSSDERVWLELHTVPLATTHKTL